MSETHNPDPELTDAQPSRRRVTWIIRAVVTALIVLAISIIWVTNNLLTDRYTAQTRNDGEVRLALYSNALTSELRRSEIVPLLLSRDPTLTAALNTNDYSATTQRLISFAEEIGTASLRLLDEEGRIVASSAREELGSNQRQQPYFINALRGQGTVFNFVETETGAYLFTYSRKITSERQGIGVVVVEVDLRQFEARWRNPSQAIMLADSEDKIILATDPGWRGKTEIDALEGRSASTALSRAFESTGTYFNSKEADAYLEGEAMMRLETNTSFRGWTLVSYTTYDDIRSKVNGYLAIEVMFFAILLALTFFVLSRRAQIEAGFFRRESEDLRALNARLSREIAERKKVEKSLQTAEQSLAQSQKLAALGEMSAAVSHELNQPLAAMKTYLAGAKLLLQRSRPEEAQSSFQRIDDLIERMGAITKQLKSYARKSGDQFEPVDMRDAIRGSLSIMEPQLKRGDLRIITSLPDEPVIVLADHIRIEQVIINLFRNALDATKTSANPQVDILLNAGETATLTMRDNGEGIKNLDELFEPFYTTKQPGEGVGLGLAISSGIVSDLGGRLTARNGENGGAVFEIQLPLHKETDTKVQAAE